MIVDRKGFAVVLNQLMFDGIRLNINVKNHFHVVYAPYTYKSKQLIEPNEVIALQQKISKNQKWMIQRGIQMGNVSSFNIVNTLLWRMYVRIWNVLISSQPKECSMFFETVMIHLHRAGDVWEQNKIVYDLFETNTGCVSAEMPVNITLILMVSRVAPLECK